MKEKFLHFHVLHHISKLEIAFLILAVYRISLFTNQAEEQPNNINPAPQLLPENYITRQIRS